MGTFLAVQCTSMQGSWVQALVRELSSHMQHGAAKMKQNNIKNKLK